MFIKIVIKSYFNAYWIRKICIFLCFYGGNVIEVNKEEAAKYYKIVSDKEHVKSKYSYAKMLRGGDRISIDKEDVYKYLKTSDDKDYQYSIYSYA